VHAPPSLLLYSLVCVGEIVPSVLTALKLTAGGGNSSSMSTKVSFSGQACQVAPSCWGRLAGGRVPRRLRVKRKRMLQATRASVKAQAADFHRKQGRKYSAPASRARCSFGRNEGRKFGCARHGCSRCSFGCFLVYVIRPASLKLRVDLNAIPISS
jgi:hypothetical protein